MLANIDIYWNTSRIKALNGMIKWKSKPKSCSKIEVSGLSSVRATVIFLKQADKWAKCPEDSSCKNGKLSVTRIGPVLTMLELNFHIGEI